jgi:ribonuclease P protein component
VGDAAVVVLARPNGLSYPRLGLAIGRKVVHAAVTRNRLKRLIRESFRRHQRTLGHLDIVVWVRKDLVDPVATAFGHTLDGYWQQLVDRCGGV